VSTPRLSVRDLRVWFRVHSGGRLRARYRQLKAVDGISFDLAAGETLGVVGESGCGKSTLARAILLLIRPTGGSVTFLGRDLAALRKRGLRAQRRHMQMVFQDPLASLDPRMSVGSTLGEPLRVFEPGMPRAERAAKVREMMEEVGLLPSAISRYPHEFSGGQCQRIGIARAMILRPKLVICDEPVSALDVSIRSQIINLLMDLQKAFQLSLLFVSHDLSVVRHISHRVMVMYLGRVMEIASREALFSHAQHPYTQALISAVPSPETGPDEAARRIRLSPDLPTPLDPPGGCVFHTRCSRATGLCRELAPPLRKLAPDQLVACHFPG
jgi:oligopeptide transport system ATP-binding protein